MTAQRSDYSGRTHPSDGVHGALSLSRDDVLVVWRKALIDLWQLSQRAQHPTGPQRSSHFGADMTLSDFQELLNRQVGADKHDLRLYMALAPRVRDQLLRIDEESYVIGGALTTSNMFSLDYVRPAEGWDHLLAHLGAAPVFWQRCWYVNAGTDKRDAQTHEWREWWLHPDPERTSDPTAYSACMSMWALADSAFAGAIYDARASVVEAQRVLLEPLILRHKAQMRLMDWAFDTPQRCTLCGDDGELLPLSASCPSLDSSAQPRVL